MEKVVINATKRSVTGKQVGALRREGKLPGVMYGHNFDPIAISMDLHTASMKLAGLSGSTLIYINLDGTEKATLVREKQRDYIKGTLKHIDFQVVSLTEKIRARVNVELTGSSPAVKDLNGVIVTGSSSLEVECFPQYLPERFIVDISKLARLGEGIYVRDLPTSADVAILTHGEEMLVIVTAAAGEETEGGAASGVEEPEIVEKRKKEEVEDSPKK